MEHNNAHYAAMHETLDDNVGRIRSTLEESGVADNTIIIFTSDNGGFINNYDGQTVTSNVPLRSGKGSLYEGGVRVPLIVYWPGTTEAGSVSEQAVVTADLYPTILQMTGQDRGRRSQSHGGRHEYRSAIEEPWCSATQDYPLLALSPLLPDNQPCKFDPPTAMETHGVS